MKQLNFRIAFLQVSTILCGLLISYPGTIVAQQTGGRAIFQFLNLSPSTRNSALGSNAHSWISYDPSMAYINPALLQQKMENSLCFQHQILPGDLSLGHFSYAHNEITKWKLRFQAGVQFLNASSFNGADIFGNSTGNFKVSESSVYLGASKRLNERIHAGLNMQFISSRFDVYSAHGLAFNAGLHYYNPDSKYALGFVIRNAGFTFDPYQSQKEKLPVSVELMYSQRLKHLPFVYFISFHHLQSWNVRYDDPEIRNSGNLFGSIDEPSTFSRITDNLLRHFSIGGEMLLGKKENFIIRLGYNHLRRKELSVSDYASFAGLSFGLGLKIYKFRLDYSYSVYHLSGGVNQIGLTAQLNSLFKSREL